MPLDYGATQAISSFSGNAVLIWIKDDGSEIRLPLFAATTTIGRDPSNMIPINDAAVSRFHAKLLFQNGQYILADLGSANKTYVNGQEIKETALQSGCEIRFATQRFVFQVLQPAIPATPPSFAPAPPYGAPPPSMPIPPQAAPFAAGGFSAAAKKKPKPILILGAAFVVLLIVIVVIAKMTSSPNSSTTEKGGEATPATLQSAPASQTTVTPPPVTTPSAQTVETPTAGPGALPSTSAASGTTPVLPSSPQDIGRLMDDAAALESAGKLRDARIRYEQVLKIDSTHSRARARLEEVKRQMNDAINLHFKNAKQAFDFLRLDEAIQEWNLVMSLADPTDSRYVESQRGIQQAQAMLKR